MIILLTSLCIINHTIAIVSSIIIIINTTASKSPLTIRGIKSSLLFARDNSVRESLQQVKSLNAAQLYSNDLRTAMMAHMKKNNPEYSDP